MSDETPPHIVVAGAMGVGKTTVGRLLAMALGRPFLDSDEMMERKRGEEGVVIAARDGIERLHELELTTFLEMCSSETESVIAAAASVVDHEAGRSAMAENFTVWLRAPDEVATRRGRRGHHRRPMDAAERSALRMRREPLMEGVSRFSIDTEDLTPHEVAEAILGRLPG